MLTISEQIHTDRLPAISLLEKEYPGKRILFMDIETTGFTPDRAIVYLIGLAYRKDASCWEILQLFNDDGKSEPEVLMAFFRMLPDYDLMATFNGERFDIPFLEGRLSKMPERESVPMHLDQMPSLDLLKLVRPMKYALGLPNVKQKTVERYLGVSRTDKMDGGQLISVYWDYVMTNRRREKELVLQHNRDDMEGMLLLSGIFSLRQLLHPESLTNVTIKETGSRLYLQIEAALSLPLPHALDLVGDTASVTGDGKRVTFSVPVRTEPLYYFYEKKTDGAEKKEGFFVPLPKMKSCPNEALRQLAIFRESFSARQSFIPLTDAFLGNPEKLLSYAGALAGEILS